MILVACAPVAPNLASTRENTTLSSELLNLPRAPNATMRESCEPLEYSPDYDLIACVETDAAHDLDVFEFYAHAIESAGWRYTDHHGYAISYERPVPGSACRLSLHFIGTPDNPEQYIANLLEQRDDYQNKMIFRFLVRSEPVCPDESPPP
jgi:hypothetical protein